MPNEHGTRHLILTVRTSDRGLEDFVGVFNKDGECILALRVVRSSSHAVRIEFSADDSMRIYRRATLTDEKDIQAALKLLNR